MSIVKMSKFRLVFFESDQDALLQALQQYNDVHVDDLQERQALAADPSMSADDFSLQNSGVEEVSLQESLDRVKNAIEILTRYAPPKKGMVQKMSSANEAIDYAQMHEAVKAYPSINVSLAVRQLENDVKKAKDDIQQAKEQKRQMQHWQTLDLPLDALHDTHAVEVFTGSIPTNWIEGLKQQVAQLEATYLEVVSSDSSNKYVLLITDDRERAEVKQLLQDSGFVQIDLRGPNRPSEIIALQDAKVESAQQKLADSEQKLREMAKTELRNLYISYEVLNNKKQRFIASHRAIQTPHLRVMEGYVPTEKQQAFADIVARTATELYDLEVEELGREAVDTPILLENNGLVEPFEQIVTTYALPKYNEIDPTPILMPWYFLFFGLMVADLGYGLLMFLGSTLMLKLFKFKPSMIRSIKFFRILSVAVMICGALFGSFFGGIIPLPKVFDPTVEYMGIVILSLVVGFVHILFGLGVKAFLNIRDGRPLDAVFDVLFWYFILFGALGLIGGPMLGLSALWQKVSMIALIVGALGIFLFSARDEKGFGRFGWGLYNLYGATSYVGDLVSYTRIAALLLSGAYIGYAVNLITEMLFGAGPAGMIGGIIIFIIFHLFNTFLSSLSGYVHGMRLIYVEFFGKFYEGGGKAFEHLRAPSEYMDVK